jgi:hypothetical protein
VLQSLVSLCQRLAIHSHAVVGKIEIALHLANGHQYTAVERDPCDVVRAGDVKYRVYPGGHDGVSEGRVGRCLAAGQVSLQVDSFKLLPLICYEKRSRAQTGWRGTWLSRGGVLLWGHECP